MINEIERLIINSPIPEPTKEKLQFVIRSAQASGVPLSLLLDGYTTFNVPDCPLPYAKSEGAVAPGFGQNFRGPKDSWGLWDSHSPTRYGLGYQVDKACRCLGYDGAYWDIRDSGMCDFGDGKYPCDGDVIATGTFGTVGGAERYVWKAACPTQCEESRMDGDALRAFDCLSPIRLWDVVKLPYEYAPDATTCQANVWVDLVSKLGPVVSMDMVRIAQCLGYEAPWVESSVFISPKYSPAYQYDFPLGSMCPTITQIQNGGICLVTHLKVLRPLDPIIGWLTR